MDLKNVRVNNTISDEVNVAINKGSDGEVWILISKKNAKTLKDFKPGEIVKLGNREFIILEHGKDTTAVITKDFATSMKFGNNGDYANSDVRTYCENEFYRELSNAIGSNNIIKHTVKLEADDGTGKDKKIKTDVSILTTDLYRRYREFLPAYGSSFWTATRVTYADRDYAHDVCYVNSDGILCWNGCGYSIGVRPFCILNSSTIVS